MPLTMPLSPLLMKDSTGSAQTAKERTALSMAVRSGERRSGNLNSHSMICTSIHIWIHENPVFTGRLSGLPPVGR